MKKKYFFGSCSRNLVIHPPKINTIRHQINYSNTGKTDQQSGIDNSKNEIREKRKPTVSKNTKPKQQVI